MDSAALVEPLLAHPHLSALAGLVRASALDATLARRSDYASRPRFGSGSSLGPGHIPEGLTADDAQTPYGNVLSILDHGVQTLEERGLLGALLALSIKLQPPADVEAAAELGAHLVWLAAHTPCDALPAIDPALGPEASVVWEGVAQVLLSPELAPQDFSLTEALVAAAALRKSPNPEAQTYRFEASRRFADPAVHAVLAPSLEELGAELLGETQAPPRSPLLTAVLAVTLLLFVWHALRLLARFAFAFRRPAALRLGPHGLELSQRTELMGRVLRERITVLPLSSLVRVTREMKYASAGLYVGLIALTIGTYVGTGLFVDGVRVPGGSGPLLGLAALFLVVGLAVDFVLSTGADALHGRCRVVVVPVKGRAFCVGGLEPQRTDALLAALVESTQEPEPLEPIPAKEEEEVATA